jgi:hypothetical protein
MDDARMKAYTCDIGAAVAASVAADRDTARANGDEAGFVAALESARLVANMMADRVMSQLPCSPSGADVPAA